MLICGYYFQVECKEKTPEQKKAALVICFFHHDN